MCHFYPSGPIGKSRWQELCGTLTVNSPSHCLAQLIQVSPASCCSEKPPLTSCTLIFSESAEHLVFTVPGDGMAGQRSIGFGPR